MENTLKKKKSFFQKMAEIFFALYIITLYIFVTKKDTVMISQIVFILFAGCTIVFLLQRKKIYIGKNVMTVYLTLAWMFATVFWAKNMNVAWIMVKTMWQLFFLFFLTYNLFCEKENPHEYLMKSLYISGIVLLGYSLYTYGLSGVINMMTESRMRIGKEISQENTFGMMNATTCMVAFYYLFYRKRFKLFHIAAFALAFLFAMSSGSRKALLIVCIGVLFLTYRKYGIRQVYKVVAIVLVLSLIFMSAIQLPVFETINYRMEQLFKNLSGESGDTSSKMRMNMIADGWNLYKDRLLTGFGANNYRIVSRFGTYSHNNFIEILVDFGLIGFVLYYLIYWGALKNLWSAKSDAGKALLCVFLVRFMMEMAMVTYYDKLNWIMMAFFMIKSVLPQNNTEREEENENYSEETQKSYN